MSLAAPSSRPVHRFCLGHKNAALIPAEYLGRDEIHPEITQLLIDERRLSSEQIHCFAAGFALYWQRCGELFARAPQTWFPPRQINVLIVDDPRGVMPYLEPFAGTSLTLYASDLETHPEYVAYLFAHSERLALVHSMPAAVVYNLSYWFERSDEEKRAFARAAARARRPDAAAFVQLAAAFEWLGAIYHNPLREPRQQVSEPYFEVRGANLFVPQRLQRQLIALGDAAQAAADASVRRSESAGDGAGAALDALCDWLQQTRPQLIVAAPDGRFLWSPEAADPDAMRRALEHGSRDGIASLQEDLRVVHERTQTFLSALRDPAGLPGYCAVLEAGGGVHVDAARRAIVYELRQPAFDATAAAAPPYHRLLLGARVMHEWGHLAHAAKYLRVPAERKPAYLQARAELGTAFLRLLGSIPERLRADIDAEKHALAPQAAALPAALAKKTLARVGDYLANLLCAQLLPAEEMQAYVRANVRHHFDEDLGLIDALARYAYEVHYLALAGLPRSYFFATSRFNEYLVDTGVVQAADVQALFDAVGRVLACYAIDEAKVALPPIAST
jgi:hypothetical protein